MGNTELPREPGASQEAGAGTHLQVVKSIPPGRNVEAAKGSRPGDLMPGTGQSSQACEERTMTPVRSTGKSFWCIHGSFPWVLPDSVKGQVLCDTEKLRDSQGLLVRGLLQKAKEGP